MAKARQSRWRMTPSRSREDLGCHFFCLVAFALGHGSVARELEHDAVDVGDHEEVGAKKARCLAEAPPGRTTCRSPMCGSSAPMRPSANRQCHMLRLANMHVQKAR